MLPELCRLAAAFTNLSKFSFNPLTPNITLMSQIFALHVYRMLHKCYTRIRVGVHHACQPVHSYLQHDLTVTVQYLDKRRVVHCLLRSWSIGGRPVAAAILQSLVEVPLTDHTDITTARTLLWHAKRGTMKQS